MSSAALDYERARSALTFIPPDDRDLWVRMGMALKDGFGDEGFGLWDPWSKQSESYNERDARDVWRSCKANGGVTAGTLYHEARARGWRDNGTHRKPTPEEIEVRRRLSAERAAKEEAEKARRHTEAAKKARAIWKAATRAREDHPYVIHKQVSPVPMLREIDVAAVVAILGYAPKEGDEPLIGRLLVVPVKIGRELSTVELIDEAGRKSALWSGAKAGGYWAAQPLPNGDGAGLTLLIGEGVATALSAREAIGYPAVASLSSGNLPAVAKAMRERYSKAALPVLADLVRGTGLPDPHAIEAVHGVGGVLAVPDFGESRDPAWTDFNDLAVHRGREAVRRAIANAKAPARDGRDSGIVALEIGELLARAFPPKEMLLTPWLRLQDLVMVYAKRGVGKTHFSLSLAYAVASGGKFLKWQAPMSRRVLYVDGEMPGVAIKERLAAIVEAASEEPPEGYFRIVTPDVQPIALPDLATAEGQSALEPLIGDAQLIVLDNLSTLMRHGVENEGESWIPMATWALARRREGRAVVFVHHAGKGGQQRGSSRREDLLDVVVCLKHPSDYTPDQGARFEMVFEKARGLFGTDVETVEAALQEGADGKTSWTWKVAGATADRVADLQGIGMKPAEIAGELGVHRSTVYRALKGSKGGES